MLDVRTFILSSIKLCTTHTAAKEVIGSEKKRKNPAIDKAGLLSSINQYPLECEKSLRSLYLKDCENANVNHTSVRLNFRCSSVRLHQPSMSFRGVVVAGCGKWISRFTRIVYRHMISPCHIFRPHPYLSIVIRSTPCLLSARTANAE